MNPRFLTILIITLIWITACTTQPTPPPVDTVSTAVFQQVFVPLTQTALAASPTPAITPTFTPTFTATLTPKPTWNAPPKRPLTTAFAGCWKGPGPQYTLISNIDEKKYVELLGVGSVPGWYVIKNPYFHNPCWIEAIYLKLDPKLDTSKYPVMTPAP